MKKKGKLIISLSIPQRQIKKKVIIEMLRRTNGDKRVTALLLGITTKTIYRLLDSLGEEDSEGQKVHF